MYVCLACNRSCALSDASPMNKNANWWEALTSWLFTRRSRGIELWATEEQIQLSGRVEDLNLVLRNSF